MLKDVKKEILFIVVAILIGTSTLFTAFAQSDDTNSDLKLLSAGTKSMNSIYDIALNKVIIVGDSRMELLLNDDDVNKPANFIFDAKSGASFEWFKEIGLPKLETVLNNRDSNYYYHVVFNLGVNDIQYENGDVKKIVKKYINEYQKVLKKYSNIDFYFLSVNPIDEKLLKKSQPENIRTNDMIIELNNYFKKLTQDYTNFSYCDSYNDLDFKTNDGIHYESETSQDIIDYVSRNCINYKY